MRYGSVKSAALVLALAGCDKPTRPEWVGTVECFQVGQSIFKADVRKVGFTVYDAKGRELWLPEGCVYRVARQP